MRAFGGLDMLILNAGVFPPRRAASSDLDHRRVAQGDARQPRRQPGAAARGAIRCSSWRRAAAGWW
ncbi:MAG: hypothetical protein MZV65_37855 [Chromatiales bacterium]|nr:hypothetical protein [Chromatiales bacterium]